MKKSYINPNIKVVKIASRAKMLSGSNPEATYDPNGGVTPGLVEGRRFDFDDEEY